MSGARKPSLHLSALSPAEYAVFPKWLEQLKPARSGAPDCVEEADALRFLREDCNVGVEEEVKMLSLFERFPLGLPAGVFFALLRLASHAQRREEINLEAVFTQAPPPRTGLSGAGAAPLPPPPKRVASASMTPTSRSTATLASTSSSPEKQKGPPPEVPAKPVKQQSLSPDKQLQSPLIPLNTPAPAPAVPDEKPANPFHARSASASTGILGFDPAPNPFKQLPQQQAKPTKLVKPTPVLASNGAVAGASSSANPFRTTPRRASTNDEAAAEGSRPSDSPVQRAESARSSAISAGGDTTGGFADLHSPPLPPRPLLPGERPPPPLPPRAINPLIQAGLAARSEVRKKKEALPPKTYSVIQSSSAPATVIKRSEPRLLDGKPPPPGAPIPVPAVAASTTSSAAAAVAAAVQPPPQHHAAKRKPTGTTGYDPRRSVSDMPGAAMLRGASGDDVDATALPLQAQLHASGATPLKAPRAVSAGLLRPTATRVTPTFAPKASYGAVKQIDGGPSSTTMKGGLPSWLREQEELQRTSLVDGAPPSRSVSAAHSSQHQQQQHTLQHRQSHISIDTPPSVASSRITFLDDEESGEDDISSEHASVAASIRRDNPFFLRSARDAEALPNGPGEQLTKLAVARAAAAARGEEARLAGWMRASSDGDASASGLGDVARPLGRSKTLRGTPGALVATAAGIAPPAPPRRKLEVGPAQLDSGTYAGFGKPARAEGPQGGGLRLIPSSKKAEVGLPPHVILERQRERATRERGALHQNPPPPPPPPVRRQSTNSAISATSSATVGNAPISSEPSEGESPFATATSASSAGASASASAAKPSAGLGIRERVSGLLGLNDAPAKGARPIDALKADLTSVAERHEWLARAAERVKGQPLSEGTVKLMQQEDDAPHTDDAYYAERTHEREDTATPQASSGVSLSRRSTGPTLPRSSSAGLRRTSSGAARRSVAAMEGPFSDLSREQEAENAAASPTRDADEPKPDDAQHQSKGYAMLA